MRRAEKVKRIGAILDDLYPEPSIPLYHHDPYTLLVAVALSAQTTDKKVNEVTPALFELASTPEQMYELGQERILELIHDVGLAPTKARNVWTAAGQIIDAGGALIADWDFLESLAGVGHKTASVVMTQAFGVPAFPVDTHIARLAQRWGLSTSANVTKIEADLKKAQRHDFASCPVCSFAATKKRAQLEASTKTSRRRWSRPFRQNSIHRSEPDIPGGPARSPNDRSYSTSTRQ
ncbi:MAG: endonuclease III [Micrococcales bacterium]|nr:MAG: endonuclease III [Micrococcales bacterium]